MRKMIISELSRYAAPFKSVQNSVSAPFFGLKMSQPLTADKVSFSASKKENSQSFTAVTGFKFNLGTEYTFDDLKKKFGINAAEALHGGIIEIAQDNTYEVDMGAYSYTKGFDRCTFRILNPDMSKFCKNPDTMKIYAAGRRNEFQREYESTASEDELEILGYGSKADIIANAGADNYRFKNYILQNTEYKLFTPEMRKALSDMRRNNPAMIPIDDMPVPLTFALLNDKVRSARDIYHTARLCINIADKKNLEYLRTIDNPDFQKWIDEKLEAHAEYRAENQRIFEKFPKNPAEIEAGIQREFKAQQEKKEALEAEKKRKKAAQSLRMTAAWVLSPKTREVMRKKINSHTREIMQKYKAAQQIQKKLLSGEITLKDAEPLLSKLSLTDDEMHEMMGYYRTCWETAGTDEWKKGLEQAGRIAETYVKYGIDGFESNEMLKRFVLDWEEKYKHKKLLFG